MTPNPHPASAGDEYGNGEYLITALVDVHSGCVQIHGDPVELAAWAEHGADVRRADQPPRSHVLRDLESTLSLRDEGLIAELEHAGRNALAAANDAQARVAELEAEVRRLKAVNADLVERNEHLAQRPSPEAYADVQAALGKRRDALAAALGDAEDPTGFFELVDRVATMRLDLAMAVGRGWSEDSHAELVQQIADALRLIEHEGNRFAEHYDRLMHAARTDRRRRIDTGEMQGACWASMALLLAGSLLRGTTAPEESAVNASPGSLSWQELAMRRVRAQMP